MRWQTKVEITPIVEKINYSSSIFFIGSCFATEIGSILKSLRFDTVVNPFGVMFNPASIYNTLGRVEQNREFTKEDTLVADDIYKSFDMGSEFWANSIEQFLEESNKVLRSSHESFLKSQFVVLTFGTSWLFREISSGSVVANCHKVPANRFKREFLEAKESFKLLSPLIERYKEKQFIVTVSPVRHLKDGAYGNQLSKANLIILCNLLENSFSNVAYFPAYEILMDELRDYRFYASDMVHPSNDAIRYVWERFRDFAISPDSLTKMKAVDSLNLMKNHKPLFSGSSSYQKFVTQMEKLEADIAKMSP